MRNMFIHPMKHGHPKLGSQGPAIVAAGATLPRLLVPMACGKFPVMVGLWRFPT